jgi:hypothetical protein
VHHLSVDGGFAGEKLVGCQVDFNAVGQPIPVVVPDFCPGDVDLTENQGTSEQVLDHQRGHSALHPGRVVRPPMLAGIRIAGVGPPGGPQYRP